MSEVSNCPSCGGKSKIKEIAGKKTYQSLQDESMIKKIEQLKKAMEKYKLKSEALEEELHALKSNN